MVNGEILSNERLKGDYFKVVFHAPEIAATAVAGQFAHVRVDHRGDHILRRPFSIHRVDGDTLTIAYKIVGAGTAELAKLGPGNICDLMGPLGKGFTPTADDVVPVAVAGGYGSAATYLLTRACRRPGVLLLGARSEADIILVDAYTAAGWDVRIATNDGSLGQRGLVTELIAPLLAEKSGEKFFFYGCGPHPMLMALAKLLREKNLDGELSIDHLMCCGVGACFSCVIKAVDKGSESGWRYARACVEGPVFPLEMVYTE